MGKSARVVVSLLTVLGAGCVDDGPRAARAGLRISAEGLAVEGESAEEPITAPEFEAARADLMRLQAESADRAVANAGADVVIDRRALGFGYTSAGTIARAGGPGFAIAPEEVGVARGSRPLDLAAGFLHRFGTLFGVAAVPSPSVPASREVGGRTIEVVRYEQFHAGLRVVDGDVRVIVGDDAVLGVRGSFLPDRYLALVDLHPTISEDAALRSARIDGRVELVIASEFRNQGDPTARLAWLVRSDLGESETIDAHTGESVRFHEGAMDARRRVVWDLHSDVTFDGCQRWAYSATGYPLGMTGCPTPCAACVADPAECGRCACGDALEVNCHLDLTRFEESSGCVGCGTEALAAWNASAASYAFWSATYGRDSWDDAGGILWTKVNPDAFSVAGRAVPRDPDVDGVIDTVDITVVGADPWLIGHELGHALQFGTWGAPAGSLGFWRQGRTAREHNADVHGYRYRNLPLGALHDCSSPYWRHYSLFNTLNGLPLEDVNKYIADCHGALSAHAGIGSVAHYGVTVAPMTFAEYDQVWLTAIDLFGNTGGDFFEWWSDLEYAAYLHSGYGAAYHTALHASDAIGSFGPLVMVNGTFATAESPALVSWVGGTWGPCAFFRTTLASTLIQYSCFNTAAGGWSAPVAVNDGTDPAYSAPAASLRYESGVQYIYVLWQGMGNRIRYRRIDRTVWPLAVGAAQVLPPVHVTSGPVAAAPILETGPLDRLVVLYHPTTFPSYLYSTYIGSTSTYTDLGPDYDSLITPAVAAFPYPSRIYVVRPDDPSSSTPGTMRSGSYTLAGGWQATPSDLSILFGFEPTMVANVVRSAAPVALTQYNLTSGVNRLRMAYLTRPAETGAAEIWYVALEENPSTGVLRRTYGSGGLPYNAVPLDPAGSIGTPGALAVGLGNTRSLVHVRAVAGIGGLHEWRMNSD